MSYINCDIPKASLPEDYQIFGSYHRRKLNFINIRGKMADTTDYAVILGASYLELLTVDYKSTIKSGNYWTNRQNIDRNVDCVECLGNLRWFYYNRRNVGIRVKFKWSEVKEYCSNIRIADDGVMEAEYGLLPSVAPKKWIQRELEEKFNSNALTTSNLNFTNDINTFNDYDKSFEPISQTVYEYQRKMYVRAEVKPNYDKKYIKLSNKEFYKAGNFVWIELRPIKLLVDELADTAISEKILIAGIPFNSLKKYFDEYFSKEIFANQALKTKEIPDEVKQAPPKRRIRIPNIKKFF